jgi:glutaminase
MPTPEINRQIEERLDELYQRHRSVDAERVRSYYEPGRGSFGADEAGELADRFGICLATIDGLLFGAGDDETPFPLQSISKVFAYAQALEDRGREEVLRHVGVEPSGDAFNSIVFDERHNRPYNPMVNAGALVTSDLVRGRDAAEKAERVVEAMRVYAGADHLAVDTDAVELELKVADQNRATAYLMRGQGMIGGDVEGTLTGYLKHCSVAVTCRDLAAMGATLANGGVNPRTGTRAISTAGVRDVLSVMHTCGMYDAAGQWAFDVGVPAKSGVSGGILAVIPGKLGIAVYSPGLDEYGNSVRGINVCTEISNRLGLHVFATEDDDTMMRRAIAAAG